MSSYDAIVIGGGPAGYTSAIRIAQLGGKVCIIEEDKVGGTCLNRGCIPTKALLTSAGLYNKIKKARDFGINIDNYSADFPAMMQRKDRIVNRLRMGVEYLLKNNGVEILKGRGKVKGKGTVEVANGNEVQTIQGTHIVIASGSKPAKIPGIEYNGNTVVTSDELLSLTNLPGSLLIIGGGVIGCEFACIFSELGTKVSIVEMLPQILPAEDEEIALTLRGILEKRGIKIYTGTKVNTIATGPSQVISELSNGEKIETEKVLVCTGRVPNSSGLGLEESGVKVEKGRVITDQKMRTNIEGIYAIGDVTGGILLAHVAMAEGVVAAENIMGKELTIDYTAVPSCIFTFPEIASVGLSEKKARETGMGIVIGKFPFTASGKALAGGEQEGFVKVVSEKSGKILGVHIIGPEATNLIAEAVLCIQNNIGVEKIARTIHAHPTLPEAFLEATLDLKGEAIHIPRKR